MAELTILRPHPHIGLSTVTYLIDRAMVHRDSIGSVQTIEPAAINWMTAGRGIAHSERTPAELVGSARRSGQGTIRRISQVKPIGSICPTRRSSPDRNPLLLRSAGLGRSDR